MKRLRKFTLFISLGGFLLLCVLAIRSRYIAEQLSLDRAVPADDGCLHSWWIKLFSGDGKLAVEKGRGWWPNALDQTSPETKWSFKRVPQNEWESSRMLDDTRYFITSQTFCGMERIAVECHLDEGTTIMCPYWIVLLAAAGMPILLIAIPAIRARQRDRHVAAGLCPACGYDLRATPERCPECGHVVLNNGKLGE